MEFLHKVFKEFTELGVYLVVFAVLSVAVIVFSIVAETALFIPAFFLSLLCITLSVFVALEKTPKWLSGKFVKQLVNASTLLVWVASFGFVAVSLGSTVLALALLTKVVILFAVFLCGIGIIYDFYFRDDD